MITRADVRGRLGTSVRTWGSDKLNLTLRLRRESALGELDFNVPDWGLLGEPIPDSEIRWGTYEPEQVADIIAPDYTLEDYYWLRDDPIPEDFLREVQGGAGWRWARRPKKKQKKKEEEEEEVSSPSAPTGIAALINGRKG